ncbi:MAG TPA: HD domain-containing phosphohydrolase [Halanaerobiales bacterium]|nr:HD domain-containing phosphohydrolase [Halanaerobiales bacterium]
MLNFAERLKKLRREEQIRQIDLADYLGFSRSTITNYEQGIRFPSMDILCRIADYFNVSLDYLLGRSDIKENISLIKLKNLNSLFLLINPDDGKILNFNLIAPAILGCNADKLKKMNIFEISVEPVKIVKKKLQNLKNNRCSIFYLLHKKGKKEIQLLAEPFFVNGNLLAYSFLHNYNELNLNEKYKNTLTSVLSTIINYNNPYKINHERNVASLACAISKKMNPVKNKLDTLHTAALFHDIGKINIPSGIINKPEKLSAIEYRLIKEHTRLGYKLLENLKLDKTLSLVALQHHERLDGSGYPEGLKSNDIIPETRIITVADVVEAMFNQRPHRSARNKRMVIQELMKNKNSKFDGEVVTACIEIISRKDFAFN